MSLAQTILQSLAWGTLCPQDPCSLCLGSWGCGVKPPQGKRYLRSGRTCWPRCPPNPWRCHLNLGQGPLPSRLPRETARVMAGRARGLGWWPPQGQVCTAENALPEEKPSETPRPFHYKLLHFNPLLETMQTLIQKKKKNTSAIRIFMSIQFPGFIIAAIPRAGLAGTFLHRLAPPLPHPQSGCKGQGDGLSHAFFNFHT